MFAIPGILLLLGLVYGRPQELVQALSPLPLFALAMALALFGWLVDLRLRKSRPAFAPADGAVLAYVALLLLGVALGRPEELRREAGWMLIPLGTYFLLAHAVQSFRAFGAVAAMVVALVLFLGAIGVHQGLAPFGCHVLDPQSQDAAGRYDGRRCDTRQDCEQGDVEVNAEYVCEKIGILRTSSVAGGRAHYHATLRDPNELALAVALGLPFAWGWYRRRPGLARGVAWAASLGLMGGCVVATQLHGGWRAGGRNGWLLAASDLSFLTLAAWLAVLYVSAKIPLVALRRYGNEAATRVARTWALALVAAMGILMAGMLMVPFAHHHVCWVLLGVCGAFYAACRTHDPGFEVRFGWRDLGYVVGAAGLLRLALVVAGNPADGAHNL